MNLSLESREKCRPSELNWILSINVYRNNQSPKQAHVYSNIYCTPGLELIWGDKDNLKTNWHTHITVIAKVLGVWCMDRAPNSQLPGFWSGFATVQFWKLNLSWLKFLSVEEKWTTSSFNSNSSSKFLIRKIMAGLGK